MKINEEIVFLQFIVRRPFDTRKNKTRIEGTKIKNLPQEQRNSKYTNVYLPSFEDPALILHKQVCTYILLFNSF